MVNVIRLHVMLYVVSEVMVLWLGLLKQQKS